MTQHATRPDAAHPADPTAAPAVLARAREVVEPALRAAVDLLDDAQMRLIAGYQLGWCDADGTPTEMGGKAIRPALAVLSSEAVLGTPDAGIPGAVALQDFSGRRLARAVRPEQSEDLPRTHLETQPVHHVTPGIGLH